MASDLRLKPDSGAGAILDTSILSKNAVLAVLAHNGHASVLAEVELRELRTHHMLYESGALIHEVHFPINCVISVVTTLAGGSTIEVGSIGREGTTGVFAALGSSKVPNTTFCQVDGQSLVMSVETFKRLLAENPLFRQTINGVVQGYLNVLAQLVACNRMHDLDARCARWLLMTHDRVDGDKFGLTQEFLAMMLGVRRSGVALAAAAFQDADFIHYTRGNLTIHDRKGLEAEACECYEVTRREFAIPRSD